jgi:hypothetical protein
VRLARPAARGGRGRACHQQQRQGEGTGMRQLKPRGGLCLWATPSPLGEQGYPHFQRQRNPRFFCSLSASDIPRVQRTVAGRA